MNLGVIFLTGLTVGGLSCLAVQGGLLTSVIASREGEEVREGVNTKNSLFPTLAFLVAKFFSYVVLGFLLGGFGAFIGVSQTLQTVMQFVAGIYMIFVALNLLDIHPIFRYAIIQPPKFLVRKIRSQSRSRDMFAPAILGAMTVFIPCGTTLAIEALTISSKSPWSGALILGAFVLGTTPLFFGVGWLTSMLGDNFRSRFLKLAAVFVIYLGATSIYGSFVAFGFISGGEAKQPQLVQLSQTPEIEVSSSGYTPNYIQVGVGREVKLTLVGKDAYSCATAFRIPALGISKNIQPNERTVITFTPEKTGKISFSCSMGMYRGVIDVL